MYYLSYDKRRDTDIMARSAARAPREKMSGYDRRFLAEVTATTTKRSHVETDEEIERKLAERFEVIADLTLGATMGLTQGAIFSGPAGIGKSYVVDQTLRNWDPNRVNHVIVKGYVKATGLYKLLWKFREEGQVVVFDDADAIFFDDVALGILKAVCDTTQERVVNWLSEGVLIDEDTGDKIPSTFEYKGTVLFITNIDFDVQVERDTRLTPHLIALMSRSHYICLNMRSRRDYIVRIRQVIRQGLLKNRGLDAVGEKAVVEYIEKKADQLRELSLRMALKLSDIYRLKGPAKWEAMATVTCCRS